MASVFNINFQYNSTNYTALVTVGVKSKDATKNPVDVRVTDETIQVFLPHGRLSFTIAEVVKHYAKLKQQGTEDFIIPITDTISIHLMSVND